MKLNREQRAAIFAGEHPSITFTGKQPCPVDVGYTHALSRRVRIRVLEVRRNKRGDHALHYIREDDRARLLRSTPPMIDFDRLREDAVKPPDAASIEAARVESAYTTSPHGAVPDAGEAVDEGTQRSITAKAHARWAMTREELQSEEELRRQERAARDELRETLKGLDVPARQALLATISREIQQARLQKAA